MTAYRLKVTFITGGREYQPGDILPVDTSPSDLNYLKSKKFVEVVDASAEDFEEEDEDFEGFKRFDEGNFGTKSAEEIKRIRAKKDLASYAALLGLDVGDYKDKSLKELQDMIINYQEERFHEDDEEDEGGEGDGDGQESAE